jgi:histidinol-phosphate aminotransferase
MAALDDHAYVQRVRDLIHSEKQFLYDGLAELELAFIPTHANFILLPQLPRAANAIYEGLLRRGVIVRVAAGFGLPEAIRVTIGTRHENEKFLSALRQVLAE